MDILEYTEQATAKTVEYLRASYDQFYERIHKLVTALIAGGGAMGAYALGKIGTGDTFVWIPLGSLSITWFLIAFVVLLMGPFSRQMSPGNGPKNILGYFEARVRELSESEDAEATALRITREKELELQQQRLRAYAEGCTDRALVLDGAYIAIALSPVLPLLVLAKLLSA